MIKKIESVKEIQNFIRSFSGTLGLVPSLGNFHNGHLHLFQQSVKENDLTLVCVVLIPIIFNDQNDFLNYPRTLQQDIEKANQVGVDIFFAPKQTDLFPGPLYYTVLESELSNRMEGLNRPAHFDGVLTVILKLLLLMKPNHLYLGEKDYQQLELIRGMCREFFIPTKIVNCPIVRNEHGLALSSRNSKLSESQQLQAAIFPKLLKKIPSIEETKQQLSAAGFEVQYIEDYQNRRYGAVIFNGVRLIDNTELN